MENLTPQLTNLRTEIRALMQRLNIEGKRERAQTLEAQSADAEFWNNPEVAQKVMQEIAKLNSEIDKWRALDQRINDALELAQMNDPDLEIEMSRETQALTQIVERMSLQAMLAGPYDGENAILAIHAGAGGTEAQDWAAMLERMYLRWAQANSYKVELLERSEGEEAGLKSVMFSFKGDHAYGYLQSESGVHRLVRISPFDGSARRHTSFAKVELWPDIQENINIEINDKDLRVDTYRAGGAGGQNVQKNDTAIRLTHIPSGLVVAVQDQRSQGQNRERAMQILKARLFEIERRKRETELAALKGENIDAEWGNQIRSYVLHPYQMVKDHRTSVETGNTGAVLDGKIDEFMEGYLRAKINQLHLIAQQSEEI